MRYQSWVQRTLRFMFCADASVIKFVHRRANLLRFIIVVVLCLWGILEHNLLIVSGVIMTGGISYFVGLIVAIVFGAIFSTGVAFMEPTIELTSLSLMINLIGFCCAAWLGFQHKGTVKLKWEQQEEQTMKKVDPVVPWSVANDVRTSLAAIRFLLFPIHQEQKINELAIVSEEISRLEKIFSRLEKKNTDGK